MRQGNSGCHFLSGDFHRVTVGQYRQHACQARRMLRQLAGKSTIGAKEPVRSHRAFGKRQRADLIQRQWKLQSFHGGSPNRVSATR